MKYIITLLLSIYSVSSLASDFSVDDVLIIEKSNTSMMNFSFENGSDIEPRRSDFEIINQILMSNNKGERWATVTLKNVSSGQRIFETNHLMAVFANGDKQYPTSNEIKLSGGESASYTLYFGVHKFPILYVYTRN